MSQTVQADAMARIENVARTLPPKGADEFRILMRDVVLANLTALSPGGNLIQPGGPQPNASAPPVGVTHSTTGANGVLTVAINNPPAAKSTPIYHEISYSPIISFTQNVTTLPPTTSTNVTIPASGLAPYVRLRSSFDQKSWSPYQLSATTPIDAGLVESSALAPGATFNQTNFAQVNSAVSNGVVGVSVSGVAGSLTPYTAVKGDTEFLRPSATIVGVEPSTDQFVGWDGSQFQLKPTLAGVLLNNLEPVGRVSVVSTATPTLPTVVPIVTAGSVLGYHVSDGGAGASQDYDLTVVGGGGSGATTGQQTIQNGVLISVAPGDAGTGYGGGTSVTVSGGSPGGSSGGGTSTGGNGGRLTNV
jgi:hypothetical protein